ncbi:hypothetical protein ACWEJW_35150, partial [Streptomyces californicus]
MTLSVTFSIVATVVQGCGASPDHGAATASAPGDGKVSQQAPPGPQPMKASKIAYKPVGFALGALSGMIAGAVFQ